MFGRSTNLWSNVSEGQSSHGRRSETFDLPVNVTGGQAKYPNPNPWEFQLAHVDLLDLDLRQLRPSEWIPSYVLSETSTVLGEWFETLLQSAKNQQPHTNVGDDPQRSTVSDGSTPWDVEFCELGLKKNKPSD